VAHTERVRFPGGNDQELAGRLELPAREPRAYALIAHCFTCSKDYKQIRRIAATLAEHGYGALSFDFTGLGESEGDFAATSFSSNLADLVAAAAYLERNHAAPALLVGHSLGGAAVLAAAERLPAVRAVATIAAPSNLEHLARRLDHAADRAEEPAAFAIRIGGRDVRVGRQLISDLRAQNLHALVAALERPLLILHAVTDNVVGIEHARKLYELARHPKSFISLGDTDHLLLDDPAAAPWVGHLLAAWALRYVA